MNSVRPMALILTTIICVEASVINAQPQPLNTGLRSRVTTDAAPQISGSHRSAPRRSGPRVHVIKLSGSTHHVSSGAYGQVEVLVRSTESGIYRAEGALKGKPFTGAFETSGRRLSGCKSQDLCLYFNGHVRVQEPKRWPRGTMTTFSMTLNFSKTRANVVGIYQIGALQGVDVIQTGTLNLKLSHTRDKPKAAAQKQTSPRARHSTQRAD